MPWDNKTLATLKAMGGGSGGGGVSSWNDLTDKPFGETVERVTLINVPFSAIYWSYNQGRIQFAGQFVEGQTYYISFDGEHYFESVAEQANGIVAIGNTKYETDPENATDLPYAIIVQDGYITIFRYNDLMEGFEYADAERFIIETDQTTIKTLDPKFLPEALQFGEQLEVLAETKEYTSVGGGIGSTSYTEISIPISAAALMQYVSMDNPILPMTVELDGKLYSGSFDFTEGSSVDFKKDGELVGFWIPSLDRGCTLYLEMVNETQANFMLGTGGTNSVFTAKIGFFVPITKTMDKKYLPMSDIVAAVLDSIPTAEEASF